MMSTAWYTYLEQGRDVRPSRSAVASIAFALRLSEIESAHLFALSGHVPPDTGTRPFPDTELLRGLVASIKAPAYCTDARAELVTWNALAVELFGDYGTWPLGRRNLLWLLFTEPEFGSRLVDRDEYARRVVYTFRDRSRSYVEDPATVRMVRDLVRRSASFKSLWESHRLRHADVDNLRVDHPFGRLNLTLVMLQDVAATGIRLNAYLPADNATSEILTQLDQPR